MKSIGDEVSMRCAWGDLPKIGAVLALRHRRTGKFTRKIAVRELRGRRVLGVLVPLDTPHTEIWIRESRR